jgi:hypothetical protein
MPTPFDFEQKFEKKIKAHKNLYTAPSCVTDLKYQGNVQEIWTFSQFLVKPVFFGKTEVYHASILAKF